MRALLIAVAVVVMALLLAFVTSTASASPPESVEIDLHPTTFSPVELGTWEASGGIDDSGLYERTRAHGTGSLPDLFMPEHTGAFQEEFVLTGSQGTLTVRDQSLLTPTDECCGNVTVVWEILSGTGAYDRTSGHGKGFFGPPLTLYLSGVASKVGD